MRVIGGTLRGRRLLAPGWPGVRPTADKLRETIFNILAPRIEGASVLDAFAGTGALGIEALSRGAAHVTFIDRDHRATMLIEENLKRCGIVERYAIIRAEVAEARPSGRSFDVALLDPPYDEDDLERRCLPVVDWLADNAIVVLEHARRAAPPDRLGALTRTRQVLSGDSALAIFERRRIDDIQEDLKRR